MSLISPRSRRDVAYLAEISSRSLRQDKSRRDLGEISLISARSRQSRRDLANLGEISVKFLHGNLKMTACRVVLPPYRKYARLDSLESKTYEAKFIRWSNIFAVRLLEPGLLEEDCPITMCTENKRFSSSFFFVIGPIKFKVNYATVDNF